MDFAAIFIIIGFFTVIFLITGVIHWVGSHVLNWIKEYNQIRKMYQNYKENDDKKSWCIDTPFDEISKAVNKIKRIEDRFIYSTIKERCGVSKDEIEIYYYDDDGKSLIVKLKTQEAIWIQLY